MIIQSSRVWLKDHFEAAQIAIGEGKILQILPHGSSTLDHMQGDCDFGDLRIVPGFIDVHTHGAYGCDASDADPDGLRRWAGRITTEGVTAFLPTLVTQPLPAMCNAASHIARMMRERSDSGCAGILGVHLEGPFLCAEYCGAQPSMAILPPSVECFRQLQEAAEGNVRLITLCPEKDPDFALTRYCAERGVRVSLGHSGADFETAVNALLNGAVSFTHVFNGMSPLHHREPGMAGAALCAEDAFGEIIADGHHVNPAVLALFYRIKGRDKAIMITDSLRLKGCAADGVSGASDGRYTLGGQEIELRGDLIYLKGTDTIAGSTLRMNEGLRIAVNAGVSFEAALNSCTKNPAQMLGLGDRKGCICAGYDADLVVLGDDYSVVSTFVAGR